MFVVCKDDKRLTRALASICRYTAVLYLGRTAMFLVANTIFALVYLKARKYEQDQASNKMWINIWHVGVASNMGVVAVYALNEEFKSIVREAKNGMTGPMTYVLAKTILVLPIMFCFAIFALGIPSIVIMDFPGDKFGRAIVLWSAVMYVFESAAECLAVWIYDPIMGMLAFTSYWFGFFLFSGFLISVDDLVWPFKLFYYIFPFSYYLRSQMYNLLIDTEWIPCDPFNNIKNSAVCLPVTSGKYVLDALKVAYPLIESKDTFLEDLAALIAIALVFKAVYIAGVYIKTSKTAKFLPNSDYVASTPLNPTQEPQPAGPSAAEETIVFEESYHRRVPLWPEPFDHPGHARLEL
jgi:ABC-2 type transporter